MCGVSEGEMTIKERSILVVEDDVRLRALLVELLEHAGYQVCEARSGAEALDCLDGAPTVAVLDIDIPGMNGYALCRELKERYGDRIGVIFVSGTRTESFDRVGGLLIGADDYVVKPFDPDELVARIRGLETRAVNARESSARASAGGHPTSPSIERFGLTPRESEILGLLVDGNNQAEIAAKLVISSKTVATHIQRVLSKLDVRSRAEAVGLVARGRSPDRS